MASLKFTECLNDTWNYFFLCDPYNLSRFKAENQLSDDLIYEFTNNDSGDIIVEKAILIPLSGIANYPYHIFFQIDTEDSIFTNQENDLQFRKEGYLLEVINEKIYLMTVPYLKNWNKNIIIRLKTNTTCPKVKLKNGLYKVSILGGETLQITGWEPTIEFTIREATKEDKFEAENINFEFKIKSREY